MIGCSHGCVEDLLLLAQSFDAQWPAAIFITLHIGRRPSRLAEILRPRSPMPVQTTAEGTPIAAGNVYIAPPDHHLCICARDMRLSRGPRINWTRPAIDPMFRSAAEVHGPAVIGVIMSGLLNDGTAGLLEVHRRGGQTIVQDPRDAEAGQMPANALGAVDADHVVALHAIPKTMACCIARVTRGFGAIHVSRI